jgi:hypothetical protein
MKTEKFISVERANEALECLRRVFVECSKDDIEIAKVCGFCQRKYDKQLISQEPVEEPDLIGPDQTEN